MQTHHQKITLFLVCFLLLNLSLYFLSYNTAQWSDEIALFIWTVALLVFYGIAQAQIAKPIKEISTYATDIRRGNLDVRIPLQTQAELGNIAKTINRLADNIEHATEFIHAVEKGNFDITYTANQDPEHTQTDRLAQALKSMQTGLKQINEAEKQRKWANEGLAIFSALMREHSNSIDELASLVLGKMIEYTGAVQGGIFIRENINEKEIHLNLVACYAYNRKKILTKQIKIIDGFAEGVIGQTFLNAKTQFLQDLPEDYLSIATGTGEITPKALILVPLVRNQEAVGVLELVALETFMPYQIQLVENIAESLAITLLTIQSNEQTKYLLKESQEKEEILRTQEEEMRQNMEELKATQEEMAKKQEALETQNQKMKTSELILQKALEKARKTELMLKEKNEQIAIQEEEMRQNMEELKATQEEMAKKQQLLELQNEQMKVNQEILKKQIEKTKAAEIELRKQEKKVEFNANVLRKAVQKHKEQINVLKNELALKEEALNKLNK